MKKCGSIIFIVFGLISLTFAQVQVKNLKIENRINPLGLDISLPRFSWQLVVDHKGILEKGPRNLMQTAYEIRVGLKTTKTELWNSGKQMSPKSVFVPYTGGALQSGASYYWQVRVWDNQGRVTDWSDLAFWQMGLLQASDWKAKWIESESAADTVNGPALLFRKNFSAGKQIISATAFVTAHGMYEAFINGARIGDAFLTPGWTSYHKRLQYQVYDISALLRKGDNVIGVNIGSGWYRTPLAWGNNRNLYGKKLGLLLQMEINYGDGTREIISSDGSWKTSDEGPIRSSEIYNGEIYDARMEKEGWNKTGYNDAGTRVWTVHWKDFPTLVVAPQSYERYWSLRPSPLPAEEPLVMNILAALETEFDIDPDRIYLAGQSMGGFGVWEFLEQRPDLYAAAIVLCGPVGPGMISDAHTIAHIPVWVFQGAKDDVVSVADARSMLESLRKAGGHPRYTEYQNLGHVIGPTSFSESGLLPWLFAQKRNPRLQDLIQVE